MRANTLIIFLFKITILKEITRTSRIRLERNKKKNNTRIDKADCSNKLLHLPMKTKVYNRLVHKLNSEELDNR